MLDKQTFVTRKPIIVLTERPAISWEVFNCIKVRVENTYNAILYLDKNICKTCYFVKLQQQNSL